MSSISTSTSSYGASFKISGLISGLDTDDIVSKLVEVESAPLTTLQTKQTEVTAKLTAWRELNTRILALKTQTNLMSQAESFQARSVTSSNEDVLAVSAQSGTNTSSHTVTVEQLAQSHQLASQTYESTSSSVGTGSITITVGSLSHTLEVSEDNNTLQKVANSINNGNYGVTASLVDTGDSSYRMILTAKKAGADNEIQISSSLAGGTEPTFDTEIQAAQDAKIVLGTGESAITIYRDSNTISDVIDGVTLTLKSTSETPVSIALTANTSQMRSTIDNFITQFNNLVSYFDAQFAYDSDSGETGTLFSSSELVSIKSQIYSLVTGTISSTGEYRSLAEVGIEVDESGKLSITDTSTLTSALENNLEDVLNLFTNSDSGIAVVTNNYLSEITDLQDGLLTSTEQLFTEQLEDIAESIDEKQAYLDRLEERYYEKFSEFEAAMAELQSQSSYMDAQLAALENNSYKND